MNLSPECPECGGTRSTCRTASMDSNGNRIRHRQCGDCEEFFTTLEVAIPFSFSGADSLKRTYHGTTGPIRRTTDFFSVRQDRGRYNWTIRLWRGKSSNYCRRGLHELVGDNVYVNPTTGHRVCQTCRRESANKRYANRMAKMPDSLRAELREERRLESAKRVEYRKEWARRRRQAA